VRLHEQSSVLFTGTTLAGCSQWLDDELTADQPKAHLAADSPRGPAFGPATGPSSWIGESFLGGLGVSLLCKLVGSP
jgi:hypothetical protein